MYTFVLIRKLQKRTSPATLDKQIERLVDLGLKSNRGKGWVSTTKPLRRTSQNGHWVFRFEVTIRKAHGKKSRDLLNRQANAIKDRIAKAGKSTQFGGIPWEIEGHKDGGGIKEVKANREEKNYGEVKLDDHAGIFTGIFGREAHILRIRSAVQLAMDSQMRKRYHVLLHGPPGCGKTDLLSRFCGSLGEEGSAYLLVDATSTTQAGIVQKLMESPVIPPVMVIEEIEKADDASLRWLLGVLDQRGEVRRVNFRVGYQYRAVRLLVLATANDINLFRRVMSGALASRFSHQIYCPRPDRDVMRQILVREVASIQGRSQWIDPALDFCMDELGLDDPRKIIPICLCGQDKLLDGTYQTVVKRTMDPEEDE